MPMAPEPAEQQRLLARVMGSEVAEQQLPSAEQGSPGGPPPQGWLAGLVAMGKKDFGIFKATPLGILLLQRLLPLQDIVSDELVTFCIEGFPLCSNAGLWWTGDWWWGHLSLAFIIVPYVLLWLLSAPLIVRCLEKQGWSQWKALLAWLLVGLPCVILMDGYLLLRYPLSHPTASWLMNFVRLRIVLESLVESPTQLVLQIRVAFYTWWHRGGAFPGTMLFSIGTSLVNVTLTLLDVKADADASGVSVLEQFVDLFLVGFGWRAPLLHVLRSTPQVDYSAEGALRDEHVDTILKVCATCQGLKRLTFHEDNGISTKHAGKLVRLCGHLDRLEVANWMEFKGPAELKLNLRSGFLGDAGVRSVVELLGKLANLTSLQLDLAYNRLGEAGARSIAEAVGKLANLTSLQLDLAYNSLGEVGARSVAEAVELANLSSLQLGLASNSLGEVGAMSVAEAVGKQAKLTSLQLGLADNALGEVGARSVAKVVGKQAKLTSLQLGLAYNSLGEVGATSIAEAVGKLANLNSLQLGLADNSLGEVGARSFAEAVGKQAKLTSLQLDFADNALGEAAAGSIAEAVGTQAKLTSLRLNLRLNSLGEAGRRSVEEAVAGLPLLASGSVDVQLEDD